MSKGRLRILFILGVAVVFVCFWSSNIQDYLTLTYLKSRQSALEEFYQANATLTICIYFVIYVAVTGLSLPGAAIMTLAGGALFGFWIGTVIVSFSSTIGATFAFLASRFFFRDLVQDKFGGKLRIINNGLDRDGVLYLFWLRLFPVIPFFLINLLLGLSSMRTMTFFYVSQLGMLPGTAAYVNAGTQLAQVKSAADIISWPVFLSFALIGILPLSFKWTRAFFQQRKLYFPFKRPAQYDYNIVVIGAGSAGLVCSYIASALKARVALIEKEAMGGDCLNTGCIPSKTLLSTAKLIAHLQRAGEFGLKSMRPEFEFSKAMERVQRVIQTVKPHDSVERYTKLGVECFHGTAKIRSPFVVEVDQKLLTTKNIIIAAGGRPIIPPIPGLDKVGYLTSDTIWGIRKLPQRLLVVGGGPIGCELAQAFLRLGSEIHLVEMLPRLLIQEDVEVSEFISQRFSDEGMHLYLSTKVLRFELEGDRKWVICEHKKEDIRLEFDEVLLAVGRKASSRDLGLEALGMEVSANGTVAHDAYLRTTFPNIYVCGDVAGPYQFTHTASYQAWYATVNALFRPFRQFRVDYRVIPWCTFTDPEVARVGLSEKEAKDKSIPYEITRYDIDELDRAITEEEACGFVKVLTPPRKDKILGVTIVGAHAGEVIQEFIFAMKHGLGLNKVLGTIHIYPTFSEANKFAAGVWRRNHAPLFALKFLEGFHRFRKRG